jgi:hypothetical protein
MKPICYDCPKYIALLGQHHPFTHLRIIAGEKNLVSASRMVAEVIATFQSYGSSFKL